MGFTQPFRDDNNSTRTALSADATFTGEWTYVAHHNSVMAACKADVAGTLYMEFGSTGSGSAESTLTYTIPAGINQVHRLTVTRPWFRLRYTNGSTGQSTFDLQAMVGDYTPLSAPLNLSINQSSDAATVRVLNEETQVAAGRISGFEILNKFGANTDIDTTGNEDVWDGGGMYTGFPTGDPETVEVFSSSTNDDEGGTGAEKLTIFGLDANWDAQSEEITLNGTNAVATTSTWRRVFRAVVTQSANGANTAFNAGTITVRHTTTTANVFEVMPAGVNQSRIACYTVPAGKTLYIRHLFCGINRANSASATGAVWYRPFGGTPRFIRPFTLSNAENYDEFIYGGIVITEKSDISIRIRTCSANNTSFQASFDGIIVDN